MYGDQGPVYAVAFTPDGRRAVSGSLDMTLRIWDLETGERTEVLEGHLRGVEAVALTPDGRRAVSRSAVLGWELARGTFHLWDLETGDCTAVLEGHEAWVNASAITPDGRRAVSGSEDSTLRIWDLEKGECTAVLEGHEDAVRAVAITRDGRRAASGSSDGTLRIWDLETGECIALYGCRAVVWAVGSAGPWPRLVAGDGTGAVHILEIENLELGPHIETAWLSADGSLAVRCPFCAGYPFRPIPEGRPALGRDWRCPACGRILHLNTFTISTDWRACAG
ncbi:MAG: WD40 repeat domain-containing protein [Armatimonadetes bacterium]|nr:WD40 repeat domain-containing protein [Armatimonadota bacterium]